MIKGRVRGVGLAVVGATVFACAPIERGIGQDTGAASQTASQTNVETPEALQPLTVAFIGDQGWGGQARAVLRLIRAEGADLVLLQGDLDYRNDPDAWDMLMTETLGADFPVFASAGNHDKPWYGPNGYQAKLQARLNRIADATCSGDLGVQSACTFRGLFFILSGVGTIPDEPDDPDHVAYLREQLAQTDAVWRICSWHKNQKLMQVGRKPDEVGWKPYETCRERGAIVATAHEHSYSRTHLMDHFGTQSIASTEDTLVVEEGRSFAFVSGLGGRSIRRQRRNDPWWASVYTRDQDANPGALFCAFFVDGEPDRASCYFKDIDGKIPDRFELISAVTVP